MTWLAAALLAAVLLAWHLTYTAARLDRLHTRAEGALSALDGQLVRRAETALAIATTGLLDPAATLALASAATGCLDAGPFTGDTLSRAGLAPGSPERAGLESELTTALHEALDGAACERLRLDDDGAALLERLAGVGLRVQLARRFHADAVEDAVRVRRLPLARLFHLAGHAAEPAAVLLDDRLPDAVAPARTLAP